MPLVCRRCAHVNPDEAYYCHHDGCALDGRVAAADQGPPGARPFASPFHFPSGLACRSFDELVLACERHWDDAHQVIRDGYLDGFLGGIGRADLAQAARLIARAPDPDRALDEFLCKLPSTLREAPALSVRPGEVSLEIGARDRARETSFQIALTNRGMGLVYGCITSDCPWLNFGAGPEKIVQFRNEVSVTVHVDTSRLRVGSQPQVGQIHIETNAGAHIVTVQALVPVVPFPTGVLAGARTPRDLVSMSRFNAAAAAPLFENGTVAQWYRDNGMTYPVLGPAMTGVHAIQQFYEALGVAQAPQVQLATPCVVLAGAVGSSLTAEIALASPEQKSVYAYAASNLPWLVIGPPLLERNSARIPLRVPSVPDRAGELLQGQVEVATNGNQRFVVEVTLNVLPGVTRPPTAPEPFRPAPPPAARRWYVPALVGLGVCLLGVVALYFFVLRAGSGTDPAYADERPRLALRFHDEEIPCECDREGRLQRAGDPLHGAPIEALWEPSMRFGLTVLPPGGAGPEKRLTFSPTGLSNNAVVRLDDRDFLFGERALRRKKTGEYLHTRWLGNWVPEQRDVRLPTTRHSRAGRSSTWAYDTTRVEVTQTVSLLRGPLTEVFDTCLIRYTLRNRDAVPHRVGIRFLLDTFIGDTDGVPFLLPGTPALNASKREYKQGEPPPDFLQALERDDLANPGTIARIGVRVPWGFEAASRVTLGGAPTREAALLWEVPVPDLHSAQPADSVVVLYWPVRELGPGEQREVAFTYGLGTVRAGTDPDDLGLTASGSFQPGGTFTLTAYVPASIQTVRLRLPEGFTLLEGTPGVQVPPLPPGTAARFATVSWKIRASATPGTATLKVDSSTASAQAFPIHIRATKCYDD